MLPEYKNDEYYRQFIGRCFKMDMPAENYSVCKILDFNNREFYVENCYLGLGASIITNQTRNYCFVDRTNYKEISKNEYENILFIAENAKKYDERVIKD